MSYKLAALAIGATLVSTPAHAMSMEECLAAESCRHGYDRKQTQSLATSGLLDNVAHATADDENYESCMTTADDVRKTGELEHDDAMIDVAARLAFLCMESR